MTQPNPARSSGARFALLYRLSQTFSSSLNLDEVLNLVMDEVISATNAERGFVMLREHDGQAPALVFRAARGMDQSTIDDPQFQVSRGVVEQVAREGQPVLTSDAQRDDRFSMRQSVLILGLRSILCVPLRIKDRILGTIYVDNRLQAGIFGPDDLELLAAIAASAAIAIENARLYQVAVDKGRMERELQVARDVQASLLPHDVPNLPGWEFAACWRPAHEVAGDFYDFIPGHAGQLSLVIADVSDKGMPAALFMALSRSIVRASVGHTESLAHGIARANELICADATGGMFVTLFCARFYPGSGDVTFVNAGHNPPLLHRRKVTSKGPLRCLSRTGMALGVLADTPLQQQTVRLEPGEFLLLYTDGVIDAMNSQSQPFGMARLQRVILEHRDAPATGIVAALEGAIHEFAGSAAQFDDIAIVIAKRL